MNRKRKNRRQERPDKGDRSCGGDPFSICSVVVMGSHCVEIGITGPNTAIAFLISLNKDRELLATLSQDLFAVVCFNRIKQLDSKIDNWYDDLKMILFL
ncbi:hypothetical protein CEXT_363031 [Caerostris extrusa]|uniref:Uncharacterized protein n=1 Tax=Caerostris extrusa TaxID=172846 RepID=A0AAV4NCZ5_CAEEX|nr:hypothetical protein CEXT_363031 [Caerostris extrusa]